MKTIKIMKFDEEAEKKVMKFFSSLADPTRLRILLSLTEGQKSVGEIYNFVGKDKMTLSAISHQLKQLNDTGIVVSKRNGQEKIFQLSNDFCWCIIRDAFKHFSEINIENSCPRCSKVSKKGRGQK